jgi:integrase
MVSLQLVLGMATTGTIRFDLRSDKMDNEGKSIIRLIYQVKSTRRYFSTGRKLILPNWDPQTQTAVYVDVKAAKRSFPGIPYKYFLTQWEVKDLNNSLSDLVGRLTEIETRFKIDKIAYNADMVVSMLREHFKPVLKKSESKYEVIEFISKYISDHEAIRVKGSLSVYKSLINHLRSFVDSTGSSLQFSSVDVALFLAFQNYLVTQTSLLNITISKQLSTFKTLLNYARTMGISVSDKYRDFKIKREELEVLALNEEEFLRLYYFDLSSSKKYDRVRDAFCFSCVTGLRYSDLSQLKNEHISETEINIRIQKTKQLLTIPLNKYSKEILLRYTGEIKPLPVISNQKMNKYIKKICELAGIDSPIEIVRYKGGAKIAQTYPKYELMSVHIGRKTFATLSLIKGMSSEVTMSITGHKDYKSFSRYVRVAEKEKQRAMSTTWGD